MSRSSGGVNSLEVVTREWFAKISPTWEQSYADGVLARFTNDIFPWLGSKPIDEITAPELLSILRKIESRGATESAHRAKRNMGQVFRYAIATGRCERDLSADLKGALSPVVVTHLASTTNPRDLAPILIAIHGYRGTPVVTHALKLAPLLFVRPGELRSAEWKDINFDLAEWRYFVNKTKTDHIVPLATQSVDLLRELHRHTGTGRYLFPGSRTPMRCMSENAVLVAMRSLGIEKEEMSGHGFRAAARTIMDEVLSIRVDYIEQ